MQLFIDIAYAALALLIAVLAVYLSVKFLGKLAKFIIIAVVVGLVLWFLFSDSSFVNALIDKAHTAKDVASAVGNFMN